MLMLCTAQRAMHPAALGGTHLGTLRGHVPEPPGRDPDQTPDIPPPRRPDEDIDLPPREDPAPVRDPEEPRHPQ